jgi:hypothetical protein
MGRGAGRSATRERRDDGSISEIPVETSWVTVNEDSLMRGYACLVLRRRTARMPRGRSFSF